MKYCVLQYPIISVTNSEAHCTKAPALLPSSPHIYLSITPPPHPPRFKPSSCVSSQNQSGL